MVGVGGGQDDGSCGLDGFGSSVVDVGRGVQAQAAVAVLIVVPGEEVLAVRSCCLDGVEAAGEALESPAGSAPRIPVRQSTGPGAHGAARCR